MPGQRTNRQGVGFKAWAAASGAVSVTDFHKYGGHSFITNDTAALTLALPDGDHYGQLCFLKLDTLDTNSMVITPANFADGTTITFDASLEHCVLMWTGSEWAYFGGTCTIA